MRRAAMLCVLSMVAMMACQQSPTESDLASRLYLSLDQALRANGMPAAGPLLPHSYSTGHLADTELSFVYDDALIIIAYVKRGSGEDSRRAARIGDALLAVQRHDVRGDGRVRASYQAGAPLDEQGNPRLASPASFSGINAWAGLALVQLYDATGDQKYLEAAVRIAEWIQTTSYSSAGVPGYTGGLDANDKRIPWKSTEHNIDIAAFFTTLAEASGNSAWQDRARLARSFVQTMWNDHSGHFFTGTGGDGGTPNREPVPADAQTWGYLLLGESRYARALDWTRARLGTRDNGFTGVRASSAGTEGRVWFEGTAQLVLALAARDGAEQSAYHRELLDSLDAARRTAPNADGYGLVAASADGLRTGMGDTLYASVHTGTTAWAALAATGANPFVFG